MDRGIIDRLLAVIDKGEDAAVASDAIREIERLDNELARKEQALGEQQERRVA